MNTLTDWLAQELSLDIITVLSLTPSFLLYNDLQEVRALAIGADAAYLEA